jgi:CubicO group peptidase (beta-lactamase class C family)
VAALDGPRSPIPFGYRRRMWEQKMQSAKLDRQAPESKNVNPQGIIAFLDEIEREKIELHSFMMYCDGAVVAEGFWKPYSATRPHMQHSAAKSWTAAAVGLAIDEGFLSLEDKVTNFFPEYLPNEVGEHLAAMTVKDLLTMRTGHRSGISGGEWRQMRGSWIQAFLSEPVVEAPGKTFIYSSASSYMLSAIVTRVTGQTVQKFLERRLFQPLQMGPIHWDQSPEGLSTGGNGISCLTEDVVKFGVLHLENGRWKGRQILPEAWVREATRNQVDEVWMSKLDGKRFRPRTVAERVASDKREGYGYQWWMTPNGGYRASGVYGQQCVVLPDCKAVIVFTSALVTGDRRLLAAVWKHLYPAFGSTVSPQPSVQAQLTERLGQLALQEIVGLADSPLKETVDGRSYAFPDNEDQIAEIATTFDSNECEIILRDHRGTHRIRAGFNCEVEGETTMTGNLLHHEYQPDSMRVLARAAWIDAQTLAMTWRFIETAFCDTVLLRFQNDGLYFDRSVNTNAGPRERPTLVGRSA